jgi:hypothetical protein
MITGYHSLIYSSDPDATRGFLRDALGWPSIDAGGGWLIFKTPPSEVGVHPTGEDDVPHHQIALMCDDLEATLAELGAKGIEPVDPVRHEDFGITTSIAVPGAGSMMLYQPLHELAHALPD